MALRFLRLWQIKTASHTGYARISSLLPNLDGTSTQWPIHYIGKQIFCKPEKGFGFDLEKTVISLKHRRFKHAERILVDRARLCNLLTTSSTHVKVTASFRLVWASCPPALKFSLGGWFLLGFSYSGMFLGADEFFSVPVEAFVHSRMADFNGVLDAEKLTWRKVNKRNGTLETGNVKFIKCRRSSFLLSVDFLAFGNNNELNFKYLQNLMTITSTKSHSITMRLSQHLYSAIF